MEEGGGENVMESSMHNDEIMKEHGTRLLSPERNWKSNPLWMDGEFRRLSLHLTLKEPDWLNHLELRRPATWSVKDRVTPSSLLARFLDTFSSYSSLTYIPPFQPSSQSEYSCRRLD